MEAEPPTADKPKRKRRWYQFTLRTLMLAVTLLAVPLGYVGWQAKIVRERQAMMDRVQRLGGWVELATSDVWFPRKAEPRRAEIPWLRTWLGDEAVKAVVLPNGTPQSDADEIKAVFSEATIEWDSRPQSRV